MNCRACDTPTVPLVDLGLQPLANHLLAAPDETYRLYPLAMRLCPECHLGQLAELVPPEELFREYVYYTSVSRPSVESARRLVERVHVEHDDWVVEIGSNDGYLLQFYQHTGAHLLGIDPARGPASAAALLGIPTFVDFFTHDLALHLPNADVIHVNNVLAHVPDLNDFVMGLSILLKPDGVCFVEVPSFADLLTKATFDTIYHEHAYYFSIRSLVRLFARHALSIHAIESLDAQGGSWRLTVRKTPYSIDFHEDIPALATNFQSRVDALGRDLKSTLIDLRARGACVWGYGAAAKATIMLNYAGIDASLIEAIADETPAKISRYIPGTGIPIRYTRDWLAAEPDYTCIFAWNFAHVIAHRYATSYHGTFFTPYILPLIGAQV